MAFTLPPKRIATTVMNSLKGGVVPRDGLEYIAVGRKKEIDAILHDVEIIEDGGAAFRFVVGKYGSGKSFLLQIIRNYVMKRGFVVVDADLSPERRLIGANGKGLATYKELVRNMSTKTRPDGGALSLILEKWISNIQTQLMSTGLYDIGSAELTRAVTTKIYEVINEIQEMVHGFDFAKVISLYWEAYREGNDDKKSKVLKWFRGEYTTKTEARQEIGINIIITDEDWYEYIKILASFIARAGYKGMYILVDELVNLYNLPSSVSRQNNYEKMLTMYNDTMQGKAHHIGIIMSGTPQCIEDMRKGVFSYEALRSRLETGRFSTETTTDMLAPILRLQPLSYEEMTVLIEKLTLIHAGLYNYKSSITTDDLVSFLKVEYSRIGTGTNITPREIIRDFIEVLNILVQNPSVTIQSIIGDETFSFAKDETNKEEIDTEFKEFEL
ncbi:MAG: ATP-binding protein [Synergistaceae bacterium]|nr:ATP-binding protein [Synergistaceae bacterium]